MEGSSWMLLDCCTSGDWGLDDALYCYCCCMVGGVGVGDKFTVVMCWSYRVVTMPFGIGLLRFGVSVSNCDRRVFDIWF